MKCKRQCK